MGFHRYDRRLKDLNTKAGPRNYYPVEMFRFMFHTMNYVYGKVLLQHVNLNVTLSLDSNATCACYYKSLSKYISHCGRSGLMCERVFDVWECF